MADKLDPKYLAKALAGLGVPVVPILKSAGIASVSIDTVEDLETLIDNQLKSIKSLLELIDRLTQLHNELQQHAPADVQNRHKHLIGTLLTGFDDSLDLSTDEV